MGSFNRDLLPDPVSYFGEIGTPLQGPGKWKTTECSFHGGSDSLRVNSANGGWVCMNCGAKGGDVLSHAMQLDGLDFVTAAKRLGAYVEDDRPHTGPTRARRLAASDALQLLYQDSLFVWTYAANQAAGVEMSSEDRTALAGAVARLYLVTQEAAQ